MFLFREYGACVLMALMLAGLLVAVCGIGYLLRVTGTMCLRTVEVLPSGAAIWKSMAMRYKGRKVICTGTEPSAMAD